MMAGRSCCCLSVVRRCSVGVSATHEVEEDDDMFDQYRKRMMLAYRFRPNPLNNPRRQCRGRLHHHGWLVSLSCRLCSTAVGSFLVSDR